MTNNTYDDLIGFVQNLEHSSIFSEVHEWEEDDTIDLQFIGQILEQLRDKGVDLDSFGFSLKL